MLIDRTFSELLPDADASADPAERRAAPRIPLETDVAVGGGGRVQTGVSSDVSPTGVCVSVFALLPVGAKVSVRFRLPTGIVVSNGVVRWAREAHPGSLARLGIELVETSEEARDTLRRFCGNRPRFLSYEEVVAATH